MLYASAAGAAGQPLLNPSRPWQIDYGETQCTAARSYGSADSSIMLAFLPSLTGDTYQLIVSQPRSGPDFAEEMAGGVDFGRGPIRAGLLYSAAKAKGFSTYRYTISAEQMRQARDAASVSVQAHGSEAFRFSLANIPNVLDALGKCTALLQQHWNITPAGELIQADDVPASLPSPGLRAIFDADDYPSEALYAGEQGKSQYQLLVSETGSVVGCYLLQRSGIPSLDAMGCQVIMERAKFTPALRGGKPVRSVVTTPEINWKLSF
jgi:hypothetical protein